MEKAGYKIADDIADKFQGILWIGKDWFCTNSINPSILRPGTNEWLHVSMGEWKEWSFFVLES